MFRLNTYFINTGRDRILKHRFFFILLHRLLTNYSDTNQLLNLNCVGFRSVFPIYYQASASSPVKSKRLDRFNGFMMASRVVLP